MTRETNLSVEVDGNGIAIRYDDAFTGQPRGLVLTREVALQLAAELVRATYGYPPSERPAPPIEPAEFSGLRGPTSEWPVAR